MTVCIFGLTIGYSMTGMKKDFSESLKEADEGKVEDLKSMKWENPESNISIFMNACFAMFCLF